MKEPKGASPLVAAPRHLRKRILHSEVPDTLLVPGADPLPLESAHVAKRQNGIVSARVQAYGRKRAVALLAVIIVSVSILALVIALILAG
ncbi:hypothetical protein [Arthrobacter sp. U41]|uniref:hypothetical protein n=1 Tax=Arthrobacter sp. U41 TaxID=1849032 RepID=UPI0011A87392|nr:hypothetical protein [Arthrobacter sp. U41]